MSSQKTSKEIMDLDYILGQMDLINTYRIFHPRAAKYILFFKSKQNILPDG